MKKVLLSLTVLMILAGLAQSQEILSSSDLFNGILIYDKDTMRLKDNITLVDSGDLHYSLDSASVKNAVGKIYTNITIWETPGQGGNMAPVPCVAQANKKYGKTYIKIENCK